MFAVPVAIVMSIMGTHFRDLKYISMIAIQALFFVSPIMLGREVLADPRLTFLEYLNPIVPLIDMFRAVVLEGRLWRTSEVAILWMWIAVFWIVAAIAGMRSGRKLVYAL
jgi:ABC-type polysaccharide/polyol phosphate export permease